MLTTKGRDNEKLVKCSRCGAEYDQSDYMFDSPVAVVMRERNLCHHCAYWTRMFERPELPYEIIDGEIWLYGQPVYLTDNANLTLPLYVMKDGGKVAKLDYPNDIGPVPEDMRKDHPDTARIIYLKAYKRIRSRVGLSCRAIGCYDRYHCYWYDAKLREPDGPWNEIPRYHKVGDEKCPSFVDKDKVFLNEKQL